VKRESGHSLHASFHHCPVGLRKPRNVSVWTGNPSKEKVVVCPARDDLCQRVGVHSSNPVSRTILEKRNYSDNGLNKGSASDSPNSLEIAVECGFGDKFVTFCYLSAARACASHSAVFELKNRATRFSTAVERLVRRVTRVVRAARASTVLSPKASINEGASHRGGHVSASTELRVSITVAITASVKSQTPRGFYQPRGHPSLRRCSERSIPALALTCLVTESLVALVFSSPWSTSFRPEEPKPPFLLRKRRGPNRDLPKLRVSKEPSRRTRSTVSTQSVLNEA
jgi:hypothetical protein